MKGNRKLNYADMFDEGFDCHCFIDEARQAVHSGCFVGFFCWVFFVVLGLGGGVLGCWCLCVLCFVWFSCVGFVFCLVLVGCWFVFGGVLVFVVFGFGFFVCVLFVCFFCFVLGVFFGVGLGVFGVVLCLAVVFGFGG